MPKDTGLDAKDIKELAVIKAKIKNQLKIRDKAIAEIKACYSRMEGYQRYCNHINGYKTSSMGDPGFTCPDCGYSY